MPFKRSHLSLLPLALLVQVACGLCAGWTGSIRAANGTEALTLLPDRMEVHPQNSVYINVLANDHAVDGLDITSLSVEKKPTHGTAQVEGNGQVLYVHTGKTFEPDTFTYRVKNKRGESATAQVDVTFSKSLRLRGVAFNVPNDPPSNAPVQLVDAFPGVSFKEPVCVESPAGDLKRLFVLERRGLIKVITDVTARTPSASVFFDLVELLSSRPEQLGEGGEQGLLGLAFHPKYAENRQFYVFYSAKIADGRNFERVSRFTCSPLDATRADPSSEVVLIDQIDRAGNHQGGCLQFGPDGYLYVSLGDEGGQNDQFENAQHIDKNLFSGILRIDVDRKSGGLEPNPHVAIPLVDGKAGFTIPADNPFVHTSLGGAWNGSFNGTQIVDLTAVRTEFWATGFRNPWRMSFDQKTGELWVGDVGGEKVEEVDVVQKGGNYGWPYREGNIRGVKSVPVEATAFEAIEPVAVYEHGTAANQGNSITGGIVVRVGSVPELHGAYLYADFLSGNVWSLRRHEGQPAKVERLFGKSGISAFGADPATGDVLVADFTGNRLMRFVRAKAGAGFPQKLSETGLFVKTADLAPSRGLLPYEVNHPAWNDGASARHWFGYYATEDGQKIKVEWARDGVWPTPLGVVWVQHLELEMVKGRPESKRRIETRLLVRNNSGAYGVSYRWNEVQDDAALVAETGANQTFAVQEGGALVEQSWRFPGQSECLVCHSSANGSTLSFSTRQMNRESIVPGFTGNQIELFFRDGFFKVGKQKVPVAPVKGADLPKFAGLEDESTSLEDRARSYLAVNCALCHQPGGLSPTAWNLRPEVELTATGVKNGAVLNNGGDAARKIVVPGDPAHSQIVTRMEASDGFTRMPLLGTSRTDEAGVKLLKAWIESLR
jgi:glucose/arabinose dehydrogenase